MESLIEPKDVDFSHYDFVIYPGEKKILKGFLASSVLFPLSLFMLDDDKITGFQRLCVWIMICASVFMLFVAISMFYQKKFKGGLGPALAIGISGLIRRKGPIWKYKYQLYPWESLDKIIYQVATVRRIKIHYLYLIKKGDLPFVPNPMFPPQDTISLNAFDEPEEKILAEILRYMPIETIP